MKRLFCALFLVAVSAGLHGQAFFASNLHYGCLAPILDGDYMGGAPGSDLQLKRLSVTMELHEDHYETRASYTFFNTGPDQYAKFLLSDPTASSPEGSWRPPSDISAQDINGDLLVLPLSVPGEFPGVDPNYYFIVPFRREDESQIHVSYWQRYAVPSYGWDLEEGQWGAKFSLAPGAEWNGPVENIEVVVSFADIPDYALHERTITMRYPDEEVSRQVAFSVSPSYYLDAENGIYFNYVDIEPDFDILVRTVAPVVQKAVASSELPAEDGFSYGADLVLDKNPATAWTEGADGSGISESITLLLTSPYASYELGGYYIDSIGIIAGYAKNADVHRKNNRVKKLLLTYLSPAIGQSDPYFYDPDLYTWNQMEQEVELEDTMEMQYITLGEPVFAGALRFTIVEVYRGSVWDDTCISEIEVLVDGR
jgi:hypothetical protein